MPSIGKYYFIIANGNFSAHFGGVYNHPNKEGWGITEEHEERKSINYKRYLTTIRAKSSAPLSACFALVNELGPAG